MLLFGFSQPVKSLSPVCKWAGVVWNLLDILAVTTSVAVGAWQERDDSTARFQELGMLISGRSRRQDLWG